MTVNPMYLILYGEQLQRRRLEEADHQRLIRTATLGNPSMARKIWLIVRDRWGSIWNRDRKAYHPISAVPGQSTSI